MTSGFMLLVFTKSKSYELQIIKKVYDWQNMSFGVIIQD